MATLQKIRSKGPLLVIVIGLASLPLLPEMHGKYCNHIKANKKLEKSMENQFQHKIFRRWWMNTPKLLR